ncbi:hypothetical protein BDB00DRAFT_852371 [Zychaea mexicana]|uniref:uncharacterized protein n=1 Tax=Zychaea mexicana TaxID=64656 RepID=UPI0022FEFCCC|nr:uncharacterized protein BDB00DRAFT_852371 [Zychaea mexicana]KAI9484952.1 hypothetical protein BDB00DRAFT_852371 [Zychaea mexicana]
MGHRHDGTQNLPSSFLYNCQKIMFRRACLTSRHVSCIARSYASKARIDDRTKQAIDQVKRLEYQLESQKKREEAVALLDQISEQDVQEVYEQISAERPPRQLIAPDYLQNLRVKFLDTRQEALPSNEERKEALTGETPPPSAELVTQQPQSLSDLSMGDFEQLIYANALAKRPKEAERALELMEECGQVPSVRCYNHLMDAYANANDVDGAIQVYKRVKEHLVPDMYTYATLIKAFIQGSRLEDACVVFERMKRSDMIPTQPIFSNIIRGCIQADQIDRAWEVFDAMRLSYHQPDEVSFTLMLQACAKRGEVERALNVFEDMTGSNLYPTDVTFNVLINACAKRPDYFQAAFNLLEQMQTVYGFQPDLITYNTLLSACARKGDLSRARDIFKIVDQNADYHTYSNLLSCYANYNPVHSPSTTTTTSVQQEKEEEKAGLVEHTLMPSQLPQRRSGVVAEASKLFDAIVAENRCDITSSLLTAYLSVHVTQKQARDCMDVYLDMFDRYQVERNPRTFSFMLQFCYDQRDADFAWRVWGDYQEFLERREQLRKETSTATRVREGWAPVQQRQLALLMVNTLARGNDLKNALGLLATEFSTKDRPSMNELKTLRNKCIQLEDEEALHALKRLARQDRKLKPTDWRFRK